MVVTHTLHPQAASADVPPVPLTVEGYSVLHQMMRFGWAAWRPLPPEQKREIVEGTEEWDLLHRRSSRRLAPCWPGWSRIPRVNPHFFRCSDIRAT